MTLCGPVVLDIVQHYVERWNEIKKRKVGNRLYVHYYLTYMWNKFPVP